MFLAGNIVGTFGIKGEVKITSLMNPSDYLLNFKSIFIEDANCKKQKFNILKAKKHKNVYLFMLEGIDNIDVAEGLIGFSVFVSGSEFKELSKNEYYYHQLTGLEAFTEKGDLVGKVDHILKGGNDILVIIDNEGKEIMIPFNDELVPEVNLKEKKIIINPIEGLI